ncbi:TIGR03086 family protein [Amorphoplanes nipponensis]|uniref:TIGR03086 family protein n=1 Tax=Actinoplanes nipponensis TaxID=135950 RepID=A0A919JDR3_9ACTN|nr:TIGR03086 family metal-binding protein [Actinoplanes nipponensis]GIE47500.1 TIGR03086 family protein [Actinoplanes nipponensis]
MREHELIALAAPPTLTVIRGIHPDQLTAPTPCAEFDVRGLIDHLLQWGPSLARASRHSDGVLPPGDDALERQLAQLVAAWSAPAAWQGVTSMGGPNEMPARMVGGMVLAEIVVHGWDLARATGQPVSWDEEVLGFLHDEVAKTAELGRELGEYGAETPVPPDAPVLDRMLGLTGRDPYWARTPPA